MGSLSFDRPRLFGLIELDQQGTVLFSRLEGDEKGARATMNVVGHNFFLEVATFSNVEEFQRRFENFKNGTEPSNSFIFDCDYEDGPMPVSVFLARLGSDPESNGTRSMLVYIKKADRFSSILGEAVKAFEDGSQHAERSDSSSAI
jgi:hypothetical protein